MTHGQNPSAPSQSPETSSRREREIEERRRLILDAAMWVFREKGIGQATMGQIATAAELSKGTLYLYFESREDLLISLSNDMLDQMIERCVRIAADPEIPSGAERFAAMLTAYGTVINENEDRFRLMIARLAVNPPEPTESESFQQHRLRVNRVVTFLVNAVNQGQADGSIEPTLVPAPLAAKAWGGMIGVLLTSLNFEQLQRRFPAPLQDNNLVAEFIELFTRGLAPKAPHES